MAERFDYPTAASPTVSWLPSLDRENESSDETLDEGIVADVSSGNQSYRYLEGARVRLYTLDFPNLTLEDRDGFLAFKAATGGDYFEFTDYLSVVHTVSFESFITKFTPRSNGRWGFQVILREENVS